MTLMVQPFSIPFHLGSIRNEKAKFLFWKWSLTYFIVIASKEAFLGFSFVQKEYRHFRTKSIDLVCRKWCEVMFKFALLKADSRV